VEEAAEAVDPFAPQCFAVDNRVVLEGDAQKIDHAVEQYLVLARKSVFDGRRHPDRAVHPRPLPRGTEDARADVRFVGVDGDAFSVDPAPGDRDVALPGDDVQHKRLGPIEPQHLQTLEWNGVADRHCKT
jgi:hypothetical protein